MYLGNAIGGKFEPGEYQKIVTILPSGAAQNYQVVGRMTAQSGGQTHTINFNAALRSDTATNLSWSVNYNENYVSTKFIKPLLWTKETATAGFIFAFECVTNIYGNVTIVYDVIPRNASLLSNVTPNSNQSSEQTTIDTGYTSNDFDKTYGIASTTTTFTDLDLTGITFPSASYALTSSHAVTASHALNVTPLSASLTTTDQTISSSVAALSGSASDARNLLGGGSTTALSASLTTTDQIISSSLATLSGSASDSRIAVSASLTDTDQSISSSLALLSGSASDARIAASASLTTTDQTISSSVAALSGSASDARIAVSSSLTDTDQIISSSVATLSGSASTARIAVSASLTTTDQAISASVAVLSGSASDARQLIADGIETGISASASTARDVLASQVSGSFTAVSASLTTTDQSLETLKADLTYVNIQDNAVQSNANNNTIIFVNNLSGSASTARDVLASQVSGSSDAAIATVNSNINSVSALFSQLSKSIYFLCRW